MPCLCPGYPESTYSVVELLRRWRRGDLTAEQAVGQRSTELTPKSAAKLIPMQQRQTDLETRLRLVEGLLTRPA